MEEPARARHRFMPASLSGVPRSDHPRGKDCEPPPYAASAKRIIPEEPIGSLDGTPPEGLMGRSPSSSVTPDPVSFQPSPSWAKPRFSNPIGSYQGAGFNVPLASQFPLVAVRPGERVRVVAVERDGRAGEGVELLPPAG